MLYYMSPILYTRTFVLLLTHFPCSSSFAFLVCHSHHWLNMIKFPLLQTPFSIAVTVCDYRTELGTKYSEAFKYVLVDQRVLKLVYTILICIVKLFYYIHLVYL